MSSDDAPTPRTRENRIHRDVVSSPSVGDESFKLTCPRCGWPCRHVFPVSWNSPWNLHGGMCGQCAQEAVRIFDAEGWPPRNPQPEVNPLPLVEGWGGTDDAG